MSDPFGLQRFVSAQDSGGTFARAVVELRNGRKTSHWMWFIFPQLTGLGRSEMAQRYALGSAMEARAYLEHDVLGSRLRQCVAAVLTHRGVRAEAIFGGVDAVKLRSSMTLFCHVDAADGRFDEVIDIFFDGEPDVATRRLLGQT